MTQFTLWLMLFLTVMFGEVLTQNNCKANCYVSSKLGKELGTTDEEIHLCVPPLQMVFAYMICCGYVSMLYRFPLDLRSAFQVCQSGSK